METSLHLPLGQGSICQALLLGPLISLRWVLAAPLHGQSLHNPTRGPQGETGRGGQETAGAQVLLKSSQTGYMENLHLEATHRGREKRESTPSILPAPQKLSLPPAGLVAAIPFPGSGEWDGLRRDCPALGPRSQFTPATLCSALHPPLPSQVHPNAATAGVSTTPWDPPVSAKIYMLKP